MVLSMCSGTERRMVTSGEHMFNTYKKSSEEVRWEVAAWWLVCVVEDES
jgi:hypothetical protein